MLKEMEKNYNPDKFEETIYQNWEKSGAFNPDNLNLSENAPSYTIVLPPPNITDKLHLGHSAMLAIEDLLIRYHRLRGYKTLWVPGTDHAAIATQNVVEKKLLQNTGQTRHDLGREEFLKEVWKFVEVTQSTILKQIRKMGASLDWSREAFTLDETRLKAVRKMFVDMYKAGVIYRGDRIVNWCPRCKSTLADDEVEYKTQTTKLYTFKYSKDFPFAISTTRPETKLGDTAVAVNPKDERYKEYIGQEFKVNFLSQELTLKIVGDSMVDMEFGTGALGVTPAHSMADWQMAQEQNLELKKVIDEDGNIKEGFGDYSGLKVKEARNKIVEDLKNEDLMLEEKETENNLSICYRCDTPVEPLPSKQWFVSVDKKLESLDNKSLKEKAIEVAKNKNIEFVPNRFKKRYLNWMENLHDWCISRQIWFGHRIPVWYKNGEVFVSEQEPQEEGWEQDPDTLDTWFSSGMWTFSTLGWPETYQDNEKSGDLKTFHPTQVLETGYEIITLWVSRMIMMSLLALKEIPFETVYLHGMVLDKNGKKMSKSKGNGIDPVEVIDKFGTDATRLSLLIGNTPGNDVRLSEQKIESFKNFVNKLWNISRYVLSTFGLNSKEIETNNLTQADKWILYKINVLIKEVDEEIKAYNFSFAGEKLRDFTHNILADWYLEISKFEDNQEEKGKILNYILEILLKLWHPFTPFVTEAIWQQMKKDNYIMLETWPQVKEEYIQEFKDTEENINKTIEIIKEIRNLRTVNKIEPSKQIKAVIYAHDYYDVLKEQEVLIKNLRTGLKELEIKEIGEAIEGEIYGLTGKVEIYLLGAIDKEKEKQRLEKEIQILEENIEFLNKKLNNKEFTEKAPQEIVDKEKEKLNTKELELKKIKEQFNKL